MFTHISLLSPSWNCERELAHFLRYVLAWIDIGSIGGTLLSIQVFTALKLTGYIGSCLMRYDAVTISDLECLRESLWAILRGLLQVGSA